MDDEELISQYPKIIEELKERKIITTKNIPGELGEFYVIKKYTSTSGLPNLQKAPVGTKNVDAISRNGKRYAIKSASGTLTGVFASIPTKDDGQVCFEFLVVLLFNDNYTVKSIYEFTWNDFLKYRTFKKPENKWVLILKKSVLDKVKKIE